MGDNRCQIKRLFKSGALKLGHNRIILKLHSHLINHLTTPSSISSRLVFRLAKKRLLDVIGLVITGTLSNKRLALVLSSNIIVLFVDWYSQTFRCKHQKQKQCVSFLQVL